MIEKKQFITLITVKDYWLKLEHDYSILNQSKSDVYAAFNFYVTAYHLLDWIVQGEKGELKNRIGKIPLIKICSQIANGAKHFRLNDPQHDSVKSISKKSYYVEGYYVEDYYESEIIIELEENYHQEFGEKISSFELANKIMAFWKSELVSQNIIEA